MQPMSWQVAVQTPDGDPLFYCWHKRFQEFREISEAVSWESIFLQSWASSTLDVYERHLRILRARHLQTPDASPIQVLREYLLALYRSQ